MILSSSQVIVMQTGNDSQKQHWPQHAPYRAHTMSILATN